MCKSDHPYDGYCLLYYVRDTIVRYSAPYTLAHQIIPYCFRPLERNFLIEDFSFNNTSNAKFTFDELRDKNISSQMLLTWSASIELAEGYQMFLNNISDISFQKETLFYNCSPPWFGHLCRFGFEFSINKSFDEIVTVYFGWKGKIVKSTQMPCYQHLNCQTLAACLDWRNICDRKVDCFDGSDESNCWQLEINECAADEYRCHNGQCIPQEFFHDVPLNPDCLDGTDESETTSYPDYCVSDPAFRCEDRVCRQGFMELSCGDGQCRHETYACDNGRNNLLLNDTCANAMACFLSLDKFFDYKWCSEFCPEATCLKEHCQFPYEFPSSPILFGHVRLVFSNEIKIDEDDHQFPRPDYVCYNEKLCEDFLPATVSVNNWTCHPFSELKLDGEDSYKDIHQLVRPLKRLFRSCLVINNETHYCNHSAIYQCSNSSKCISRHRLLDGIRDCPFNDDETFNQSCSLNDAHHRFRCRADRHKCFASTIVGDIKDDCPDADDEREKNTEWIEEHIYFQRICDGIEELLPVLIDGQNETDETHCEYWQCNNTYTRCDRLWSCQDGADEINCSPSVCPEKEHSCVFPNDTSKVSCLPISRAGDSIIDCLGASDERNNCRKLNLSFFFERLFRCWNDTKCIPISTLCDHKLTCKSGDDEVFCTHYASSIHTSACSERKHINLTTVESFLCDSFTEIKLPRKIYFLLRNMPTYPLKVMSKTVSLPSIPMQTQSIQINSINFVPNTMCNRGVPILIRLENNQHNFSCLCPPSYYGDQCQYQNERVSLTLQIRVTSEWHHVFTLLIILIDQENNIESHESIEFLSIRDCDTKFNINLLYSTRPKNSKKNYSIRIDAFNKLSLQYRASWLFPLQFSFLPVYRLSLLLIVPNTDVKPLEECSAPCIHGQCFNYLNLPNSTFCQCEPHWSGIQCSVNYVCKCPSNSLCMSRSICICPIDRFGPRCHLLQSSCHSGSCANNGQCIPADERRISAQLNRPTCVCPQGYFGDRCEHQQTRIDITFHKEVPISSSLLVHLIAVHNKSGPTRTSAMKKIGLDQNLLSFYISIPFHMAFAEISNQFYLIILQEHDIISTTITTEINPSHRCASISELFHSTFVIQHLLKRIKSYHIPCQQRSDLVCFYDSTHFCLCDLHRRANCFEFEHNMTYDCYGSNLCENDGQCFLDSPKCPTSALCVCPECYYGSRCQFSTRGSTLSLDAILGYRIHPKIGIHRQQIVVKTAMGLTIVMFILGFISNLFSFLTFREQKTRDVGCGLYLFVSSITSMFTMSIFTAKFAFLLASHMGSIHNRWILHVQCVSIDFCLRLLVNTTDWLNACVAVERAVNISKGIHFNKVKSKQASRWIIPIVFFGAVCANLHDPTHRYLVDDEEEQRTWCGVQYSSSLQIFDWTINILQFVLPFSINCISALVIITTAARIRSTIRGKQSYKELLRKQLQHHKHLLISPLILVLLALPRLIISFLVGCMKSARDPWVYLTGYFISFIPAMMTFVVFVVPSKAYKEEFHSSIKRFRK